MRTHWLALGLALVLGAASPALAATVEEQVAEALSIQGFTVVDSHHTLLGRLRIIAEGNGLRRELVLNPHTGEVLRDYAFWLPSPALGDHVARQDDDDDSSGTSLAATTDDSAATMGTLGATEDSSVVVVIGDPVTSGGKD